SYPGISVLCIGKKRNKENIHAFVSQNARQLGEFHIITNQYAHSSGVCFKNLQPLPSDHSPERALVGSDVQLLEIIDMAVAMTQISYIVQVTILDVRHATGDDVDVIGHGIFCKLLLQRLCIFCQLANGLGFPEVIEL